jgi:hypothetical protein
MGSWSVYCGISNISITSGNGVVLLPIKKNESSGTYLPYIPATLPIFGTYDDYGGLEDIKEDANTALIESHFGITISEFVVFFVDGADTYQRDEYKVIKEKLEFSGVYDELKDWSFMFIDGQVYDYLSSKPLDRYDNRISYGKHSILKLIGFDYIGEVDKADRFKDEFSFGDVRVFSDGYSLRDSKDNSIYYWSGDSNSIEGIITIPEDKKWIGDSNMYILWNHLDKVECQTLLFMVFGRGYFDDSNRMAKIILDHLEDELEKVGKTLAEVDDLTKKIAEIKNEISFGKLRDGATLLDKYIFDYITHGPELSRFNIFTSSFHCMSAYLKPFVLYLTPQCGDFNGHQIILDKFAEINKSYAWDEDDE